MEDLLFKKDSLITDVFNPEDYADEIIMHNIDPGLLEDLDEKEIPRPANFLECTVGKDFLNTSILPRQLQIASLFFGEICFDCSDKELVYNMYDQEIGEIIERISFLRFGVCPKCKQTRADIVKQELYHRPNRLYVLAGQRCVTGDTLIQTKDGIFEIEKFAENRKEGFSDLKLKVFNGDKLDTVDKFFIGNKEKIKTIKTKYGTKISGTYDHPIKVFDGSYNLPFKKIKDIKKDDFILIKYGQNIWPKNPPNISSFKSNWDKNYEKGECLSFKFGKSRLHNDKIPIKITKQLSRLLGYLVSEGSFEESSFQFANHDKKLLKDFSDIAIKLFGSNVVNIHKKYIQISSTKVTKFLNYIGCYGTSYKKEVPWCILQSPKLIVSEFLKSYFEGDGGLEKRDVSCSSVSEKLIDQLRILLFNFGIFSKKRKKPMKYWDYKKYVYILNISSPEFLKMFKKHINFISDKKIKKLNEKIKWYDNKRTNNAPFIHEYLKPLNNFFKETIQLYKKILISKKLTKNINNIEYFDRVGYESVFGKKDVLRRIGNNVGYNNRSLTRKSLSDFLDILLNTEYFSFRWDKELTKRIKFLMWVNNNKVLFDSVKEIKYSKAVTYDFHIPKTHQFWSNGCISHNSGKSIEVSIISHYHTIRYLTLENNDGKRIPHYKMFGMPPSPIYWTFTASTLKQAYENLWDPFRGYYDNAPWYKNFNSLLNDYGRKKGEKLFSDPQTYLSYHHKKVGLMCESPNKTRLRGKTRYGESIDELSWYDLVTDEDSKLGSAEEICKALNNSLRTLRMKALKQYEKGNFDCPTAIEVNISSPADVNDIMMRRNREAKRSKSMMSFKYCLSGDSLIQTEKGLKRIDEINSNIKILGETRKVNLSEWHYTGKKDLLQITSETGHCLNSSKTHKIKTFYKNNFKWVKAKDLKVGDIICINPFEFTRKSKLKLKLTPFRFFIEESKNPWSITKVNPPNKMSIELAFILGAVISEGSFKRNRISIGNKDKKYLKLIQTYFNKVFKIKPKTYPYTKHKSNNIDCIIITSKVLSKWFEELGLLKTTSYNKQVPWCIMEADKESQLSFIASYIEGDGWITCDQIGISSNSKKLLHQIQVILSSHGIMSVINKNNIRGASKYDNYLIYNKIKPYLVSKHCKIWEKEPDKELHKGFPFQSIRDFFRSRKTKDQSTNCINDDGKEIVLSNCSYYERNCLFHNENRLFFSYSEYKKGRYNGILKDLKRISKKEYQKIINLIKYNYWYTPIKSIENIEKQKTYDLTINKHTPSYTANGIVVHNSTWEFNPDYRSKEDIEEFESDPVGAWRDFGASPPLGDKQWYKDAIELNRMVREDPNDNIKVEIKKGLNKFGDETVYAELKEMNIDARYPYIISIDNGFSNNCFALTLQHREKEKCITDYALQIFPDNKLNVNLNKTFKNLVVKIIQSKITVALVVYDQWNSLTDVQRLKDDYKIEAIQYSMNYKEFTEVKQQLFASYHSFPRPKRTDPNILVKINSNDDLLNISKLDPDFALLLQILTVRDLGRRLAKPSYGDDDLFRAWALGSFISFNDDYKNKLLQLGNNNRALGSLGMISNSGLVANQQSATNNFARAGSKSDRGIEVYR